MLDVKEANMAIYVPFVLGGAVEEGGGAGMVCSEVRRGDGGRGPVGLLRGSEQLQCS